MAVWQCAFWAVWQWGFHRTDQAPQLIVATLAAALVVKHARTAPSLPLIAIASWCLIQLYWTTPRTPGDAPYLAGAAEFLRQHGFATFWDNYFQLPWLGALHPPLMGILAAPFRSHPALYWLIGICGLRLLYEYVRRTDGPTTALYAVLAMCGMRYLWVYAMTPGNDGLLMVLCLAAQFTGSGLFLAAVLYTKYTGVFLLPSMPLRAAALALLLFLPWLWFAKDSNHFRNVFHHQPLRYDEKGIFLSIRLVPRIVRTVGMATSQGLCLVPLLVLALRKRGRQLWTKREWIWLLSFAALGLLLPLSRYLMPLLPVLAIGIARGLKDDERAVPALLMAVVCALLFAFQQPAEVYPSLPGEPPPATYTGANPATSPMQS